MQDSIVEKICDIYKKRSQAGIAKYGTTLDRDDLSFNEWANHLREELFDASLYLTKLIDGHKEEKDDKKVVVVTQTEESGRSKVICVTENVKLADDIIDTIYSEYEVSKYEFQNSSSPIKEIVFKKDDKELLITCQWFEVNKLTSGFAK